MSDLILCNSYIPWFMLLYDIYIHTYLHTHDHSVISDSLQPYELLPARLFSPWNSPGKNPGVSSHSLLQWIFLTQGLNPSLLHCRQILYHLSRQESSSGHGQLVFESPLQGQGVSQLPSSRETSPSIPRICSSLEKGLFKGKVLPWHPGPLMWSISGWQGCYRTNLEVKSPTYASLHSYPKRRPEKLQISAISNGRWDVQESGEGRTSERKTSQTGELGMR